ncbi:hypothetical protein H2136_06280 [Aeromonas hydrophila]|uniref:Secreted protein n=1 Tax=Aeromonas hydrophila TaxID=644 RepID=A0A926FNP1_AERHY|nr:hypothetical protein [Aeromonas hydrophila]
MACKPAWLAVCSPASCAWLALASPCCCRDAASPGEPARRDGAVLPAQPCADPQSRRHPAAVRCAADPFGLGQRVV